MSTRTKWWSILSLAFALYHAPNAGAQMAPQTSDEHTLLLLHMDEAEGDRTADASPNRFAGEIHGAQWNVGRFGHGLAFDGSGVHFDVPSHPKLCPKKAITVETWAKLHSPSADVICKNLSYFMRIAGGLKAYFYMDNK